MKTFISSIIGFIFLGSIVSAQMTTFSQGDILSAGSMNQNFKHLQDQFSLNKKEIDCSTDNLTQKINQGYNHLVIDGNCSVKNLFVGNADINRWCGYSQANNPINKLIISGKTGINSDTLTVNGTGDCDLLSAMDGGYILLENLTINTTKSILSSGASMMRIENVNVTGAVDPYIALGSERGSHMHLQNVTTTSHEVYANHGSTIHLENTTSKDMNIRSNGTIVGDNVTVSHLLLHHAGVAELKNLTIDCSSASSACIYAGGGTTMRLEKAIITGNGSKPAIDLQGAYLELKESTINSTNRETINVDYSYISAADNNTIQGTIYCTQNGLGSFDRAHTTHGC